MNMIRNKNMSRFCAYINWEDCDFSAAEFNWDFNAICQSAGVKLPHKHPKNK